MSQIVVIADDLTGAADTGATFAVQGLNSAIAFGQHPVPDVDVLVLSTESRDGGVDAAVLAHRDAVERLSGRDGAALPRWVYKKVDSALRGHPGAELHAVMDALGEERALVAPALPSEGRTTVGGRHYIGDARLERDSAGVPGGGISLAERFSGQSAKAIHHLELATVRAGTDAVSLFLGETEDGILVADAETNADLFTIASAAAESSIRLLCGSAGFARQCARALPWGSGSGAAIEQAVDQGPVLIVAGSTHPSTAAQVAHLEQAGFPIVRPSQALLDGDELNAVTTIQAVVAYLNEGNSVVLTTAGLRESAAGASFVASLLSGIVAEALAQAGVGGLVVSGGDVAASVLSGLGATELQLGGEVRPAMPWGIVRPATRAPLPVVTKAGSFGQVDALEASVTFLAGRLAQT